MHAIDAFFKTFLFAYYQFCVSLILLKVTFHSHGVRGVAVTCLIIKGRSLLTKIGRWTGVISGPVYLPQETVQDLLLKEFCLASCLHLSLIFVPA